jgi:hypothetical protein
MLSDPNPNIAGMIRQAMLQPDRYLAAVLAEWPAEDLATAIRADPRRIWQLRLGSCPRRACWEHDVEQLATLADADAGLLAVVLRALGVAP